MTKLAATFRENCGFIIQYSAKDIWKIQVLCLPLCD